MAYFVSSCEALNFEGKFLGHQYLSIGAVQLPGQLDSKSAKLQKPNSPRFLK